VSEGAEQGRLRADAQRNVEVIRRAAVEVFRAQGLGTPLDEVARRAGVSKGTIYHRFGGRQGLIDAVIDDLVADRIDDILAEAESIADPAVAFETYLRRIWLLQWDDPAANDVLLRSVPDSPRLEALCLRSREVGVRLLAAAQRAGGIRPDLTPDDLVALIWERGIIARASAPQPRESYLRRLDYVLDGLRPPH
jgi:AcrR family transcriptional regulator